jgi:hypothetical protein
MFNFFFLVISFLLLKKTTSHSKKEEGNGPWFDRDITKKIHRSSFMILFKAHAVEVITTIILVFLHNMHSCYLPTSPTVETGIDNYK